MEPENWCLEDDSSFCGPTYFQGRAVSFRESSSFHQLGKWQNCPGIIKWDPFWDNQTSSKSTVNLRDWFQKSCARFGWCYLMTLLSPLKNRSKFSKDLHAINFQSPVPSNFFPTNRVSHNSYYQYPGKSTTPCLFSTMLPGDQHRTVKKPSKKKPRANQSNTKKPHLLRNPSDPSILDLQLRSLSKNQDLQPMEAKGWSWRDGVLMCIYRFIYFILYMNIMVYVFL